MALGSTLLRVLARDFRISGFANHAIAGIYFKSLFNPHPDPHIHISNFCLKIQSSGHSQLQEALIKLKLERVISTNFLLEISNTTASDYRKCRQTVSTETVKPKKREEDTHDGATPSPGKRERRTPIARKLDELCKTVKMLVDRTATNTIEGEIDTRKSRTERTSCSSKQNSISTAICEVAKTHSLDKSNVSTSSTVDNVSKKAKSSSAHTVQTSVSGTGHKSTPEPSTRNDKRVASGSVNNKPTSKKSKFRASANEVNSEFLSRLLDDFGGSLSEMPHGKGDLSDYDSDYFERNERNLNPSNKRNTKSENRKVK
jgi:hypothetical protein